MKLLALFLVFIPAAVIADAVAPDKPLLLFAFSGLAIIPLAAMMGKATEQLANRFGEGIGGLLNATFGNAAELIMAFAALRQGLYDVVKTSVLGTIVGNTLFVVGASMLAGGLYYKEQKFNAEATRSQATMLMLAAIALILPALFAHAIGTSKGASMEEVSLIISVFLLIGYLLNLVFTLGTHRKLFEGKSHVSEEHEEKAWPLRNAVALLFGATALVAWMSELLVSSVEPAAEILGLNYLFVGVFLVAFLGSAAEQVSAVSAAVKNRMDLSLGIAIGSSVQISLFVVPLLVLLSYVVGPRPLDLFFGPGGVTIVFLSIVIVSQVAADGRSNWLKGAQLLLLYLILAAVFLLLPDKVADKVKQLQNSEQNLQQQ